MPGGENKAAGNGAIQGSERFYQGAGAKQKAFPLLPMDRNPTVVAQQSHRSSQKESRSFDPVSDNHQIWAVDQFLIFFLPEQKQ